MKILKQFSLIVAIMMVFSIIAIPNVAYGKMKTCSDSAYHIVNTEDGESAESLYLSNQGDTCQLYLYDNSMKLNSLPDGWYWRSEDGSIASVTDDGVVTANLPGIVEILICNEDGGVQASITVFSMRSAESADYYVTLAEGKPEINPYEDEGENNYYAKVGVKKGSNTIKLKVATKTNEKDIDQSKWSWECEYEGEDEDTKIVTIGSPTENGVEITGENRGIVRIYAVIDNENEYKYAESICLYVGGTYDCYLLDTGNMTNGYLNVQDTMELNIKAVPKDASIPNKWSIKVEDENGELSTKIVKSETNGQKIRLTGLGEGEVNIYGIDDEWNQTYSYWLTVGREYYTDYGGYDELSYDYKLYPGNKTARIERIYYPMDEDGEDTHNKPNQNIKIPDSVAALDENDLYNPGTYRITAIGENAVSHKSIKSVTVSNGILNIDNRAMGYYYNQNLDRYEKYPNFVIYGYSASSAAAKYAAANGFSYINLAPTPPVPAKKNQTISGTSSITKAYGSKAFSLGAATTGNGPLTYSSSNTKVVTVNSFGSVTIKGIGIAKITITAAATQNYNAASKTVIINITPKKVAGLKVKAAKKKMTVSWKKDTKASGYQITYAQNKKFSKGKKNVNISKNKTTKKVIKKLKSKKNYYVKVRAYKKVSGKKLYGAYSGVKRVKIK